MICRDPTEIKSGTRIASKELLDRMRFPDCRFSSADRSASATLLSDTFIPEVKFVRSTIAEGPLRAISIVPQLEILLRLMRLNFVLSFSSIDSVSVW